MTNGDVLAAGARPEAYSERNVSSSPLQIAGKKFQKKICILSAQWIKAARFCLRKTIGNRRGCPKILLPIKALLKRGLAKPRLVSNTPDFCRYRRRRQRAVWNLFL
jgi:hypothetical protein